MDLISYLIDILIVLFIVAVFGYFLSILKEKSDLINDKVRIQSKKITQRFLDELDLKIFKLGNLRLCIGDEIKIYLKNNNSVKGTVLGAKREDNVLCILTIEDKILELNVSKIKKLRVLSKYGRLF